MNISYSLQCHWQHAWFLVGDRCDIITFALQFVAPHEEKFHFIYIALLNAYSKT